MQEIDVSDKQNQGGLAYNATLWCHYHRKAEANQNQEWVWFTWVE